MLALFFDNLWQFYSRIRSDQFYAVAVGAAICCLISVLAELVGADGILPLLVIGAALSVVFIIVGAWRQDGNFL